MFSKRNIVLIGIFVTFTSVMYAGPFGFKMGMTVDEVQEACRGDEPVPLGTMDIYYVTPAQTHPLFDEYFVRVDEEVGLYMFCASTDYIESDKYGTQIKDSFYNILERLKKTYGTPKVHDELKPETSRLYKTEDNWSYTLQSGDRNFYAIWQNTNSKFATDNLEVIELTVLPKKYGYNACIVLKYFFTNYEIVDSRQDDLF